MLKDNFELFEKPFLISGKAFDPRGIDFTKLCHSEDTRDEFGDVLTRKFYGAYDAELNTFSGLCAEIRYTYTRNSENKITECTEIIDWYFTDGTVGLSRKNYRKY
jgi:hypothetical protein